MIVPNIVAARAFLQRFDPEAEYFTLQTFDDTKAKRGALAKIAHIDPANGALDSLARFNDQGAGIFFAVNATDGKGRQAHNIERVRAAFVDLDGAPLAPVLAAGLEPHIIVESSPGKWHVYWMVDDCPLDQFERVQRALARRFDGDPSVHDLPRVLRVPGFLHRKGEPFLSHVVEGVGFTGKPYALAEIVAALKLEFDSPEQVLQRRAPDAAGKIGEGNRRAHLFAIGRSMVRKGLSREAVGAALAAENVARCEPPPDAANVEYLSGRVFDAKHAQGWQEASPRDDQGGGDLGRLDGDSNASAAPEWPAPQPLTNKVKAELYPVEALPSTIRAAVEEVAAFVKAPLPMVASSALAAVSLAIQAHVDVKRAERLQGPSGLVLLTIADSGERKSTCDGFFTTAIRDYEAVQKEAAKPVLQDYSAALEIWESKRQGIKEKIRQLAKESKATAGMESALRDLEHNKPPAPRIPHLLFTDVTPEALAYALAKQWPSGGVVSAEAGLVFGSHGMGKDSIMRNLGLLNQLWDGNPLTVDRRTSESFTVRGARLTIALQIQEPTLREFFTRSGALARGTGFLARFLVAWPESTQGFRPFTEAPTNWPCLAAFHRRIAALLENPAPVDVDGALSPALLTMAAEAKAAWVAFHDEIERGLPSGGELYDVRDVASKTADNAARLAALFQIFEHGMGGAVGLDSFESASCIAAWHLNEARRFFGELALPVEMADAVRLDKWLIEYCQRQGAESVGKNHVRQHGPLRDGARLDAAIRELAELDRVRTTKDGKRVTIRLNPALVTA